MHGLSCPIVIFTPKLPFHNRRSRLMCSGCGTGSPFFSRDERKSTGDDLRKVPVSDTKVSWWKSSALMKRLMYVVPAYPISSTYFPGYAPWFTSAWLPRNKAVLSLSILFVMHNVLRRGKCDGDANLHSPPFYLHCISNCSTIIGTYTSSWRKKIRDWSRGSDSTERKTPVNIWVF